jgi:hypothetical protein
MNGQIVGRVILLMCLVWAAACASSQGFRCDGHLERINSSNNTGAEKPSNGMGGRP